MNLFRFLCAACCFCWAFSAVAQDITQFDNNISLPYQVVINTYDKLAGGHAEAQLFEGKTTDSGKPLHLFVISGDGDFDPAAAKAKGKAVLFINNGIHPGEPCGIDASLEWAHDLLNNKTAHTALLDQVVICIIPVYNVGGSLNRGCCSRANQFGPEQYGFRGNASYLDLNRDFIKNDSRNALAFTDFFQRWDPDVFIDTHTSNGADYQYTMTLLATQKDKLQAPLRSYLQKTMLPALYQDMADRNYEMTPYVYSMKQTPDQGIMGFMDSPRYSSGYAALFQTIGFTSETHMLKRFSERAQSTYEFLDATLKVVLRDKEQIIKARKQAREEIKQQKAFVLSWMLDTNTFETISFKGYEAGYKTSEVSGKQRLFYEQTKPYTKDIPFYSTYKPASTAEKPGSYVIPQAWQHCIQHLQRNGVTLHKLTSDKRMQVEVYYIEDYNSPSKPYEGHFVHKNTTVRKETQELMFYAGDVVVDMNQDRNAFIMATLEPAATDSYFNWNYFDAILQQKEWFSSYVFEDEAARMLRNDPELKKEFEQAKAENPKMAENANAQLYFLYKRSKHFEPGYLRYPVARLTTAIKLPVQPLPASE